MFEPIGALVEVFPSFLVLVLVLLLVIVLDRDRENPIDYEHEHHPPRRIEHEHVKEPNYRNIKTRASGSRLSAVPTLGAPRKRSYLSPIRFFR